MANRVRVVCPENEELASCLLQKKTEMAGSPKGLSPKLDMTLSKAYTSVCCAKTPIETPKQFSKLKGIGSWLVKQMESFFKDASISLEPEDLPVKGKRGRAKKRYVPQKNTAAYALLITLYRGTSNGNEFMRRQELIDATEVSGLSQGPIGPEKGKGKPSQFGSSGRDWYSGWSCMTTLISKGLVVKSSSPAKYMLTQEGRDVAKECLARSCMVDPVQTIAGAEDSGNLDIINITDDDPVQLQPTPPEVTIRSEDLSGQERSVDVPPQSLERFLHMGYSKEQVFDAFLEVSKTSGDKDISSLWPAVLCHLREEQIYGSRPVTQTSQNGEVHPCGSQSNEMGTTWDHTNRVNACSTTSPINLRGHSSNLSSLDAPRPNMIVLRMPPLGVGERFEDAYEVLLVLDDREQFAVHGSRGRKLIHGISKEHRIKVEIRRLPVGDAIWIARHKYNLDEYVLDFVVERKDVGDLLSSIRGSRYRDQKLRLQRCGLKKLIYLVEGDINICEGAESIKTACFTTEILEGFDIQRSASLPDTVKKYGHLTKSISGYYNSQSMSDQGNQLGTCPSYRDFIKRCEELEKVTISDVFAIQLMQVPQVTEEDAMAVVDLHPTLLSLARAYSLLEGDLKAQEEMLQKKSNNIVSGAASKHIFQLVWGQ